MTRLPPRPNLSWSEDNAPHADDFGDVYFSGDGLSETRAVFLEGCNLPGAWVGDETFTIGELGFGSGLNLLAAWDLWKQTRPSPTARLHFLTFEGHLMAADDAVRIHARHPELAELSAALRRNWPARARGVQRIQLTDGVTLTIHIDDVEQSLPQAEAQANVWFLDGFAPSKNPGMWSAEAMRHVARLSAPNARAATYTVAGDVRRNLQAAGFAVEKKPGHGRKRERLEATLSGEPHPRSPPKSIIILGAGIAGACAARAFLDRSCNVTVIDTGEAPGAGASGNPIALAMPRLDSAEGPVARGLIEAWLHAQRLFATLSTNAATTLPVQHLPRNDRERARFAKLLADPPFDPTFVQPIDAATPSAGLHISGAIAIRPSAALPELIAGATTRWNTTVTNIANTTTGATLTLSGGEQLHTDLVIICAGERLATVLPGAPPLEPRLGQLECATGAGGASTAIADGGYVVEGFGDVVFGATFEPADGPPQITAAARTENLATLARLRPGLAITPDTPSLTSRAAIRATTPDRLPFAGPPPANKKAPDEDPAPSQHIQLIGGLGSRGFLWAPLLAELVASRVFHEPLPVETNVAAALDPDRFRQRAARRDS